MENFVAIDFETATGMRWSACAIGIIVVRNWTITEKYWSLIQPPNNFYSTRNIEVHRITPEMTKCSPTFDKIYPSIKKYLNNSLIVCHGSNFDLNVLEQTMEYYNMDIDLNYTSFCTLKTYGKGLEECCSDYNIKLNHHDALSDAEACARLYILHRKELSFVNELSSSANFETSFNHYHTKINGDLLKKDLSSVVKINNLFYDKKVVITGEFDNWPDRNDLASTLKKLGADIDGSVTGRTEFLIAGKAAGPKKIKRMEENILNGKNAVIINEEEVFKMIEKINQKL